MVLGERWEDWLGSLKESLGRFRQVFGGGGRGVDEQAAELAAIEEARRELLAAKDFFEEATDPDLVDHAIHQLLATERKYVYLLRQARRRHLAHGFSFPGDDHLPFSTS